jgi:hypothetical protein
MEAAQKTTMKTPNCLHTHTHTHTEETRRLKQILRNGKHHTLQDSYVKKRLNDFSLICIAKLIKPSNIIVKDPVKPTAFRFGEIQDKHTPIS